MQEDPDWTAEKELCMRKGIPYQAPKPSSKVLQVGIARSSWHCIKDDQNR